MDASQQHPCQDVHDFLCNTGLGLGFARDDLGGGPASENLMGLANQHADVETFELAQLRAHIGRIAGKSGVPVNPKHVQV